MTPLHVLLAAGAALLVVTILTARPPPAPVPDRDGYFARWRRLHGDVDPTANPWLRGWLTMAYAIARPLARRGVLPDVLTVWSVWLAAAVYVIALYGGRWQILAGWLLVFSGLGDTLDGAVAVATQRTTRWGYVFDSVVDRVNDVIYLFCVVAVGGPGWLALTCGIAFGLLEYLRARAGNAGGSEVGVVTVGERAVRVICCSVGVHWGGVFLGVAEEIAVGSLAVLAVLSVAGLAQLVVAVRRDLLGVGATSE